MRARTTRSRLEEDMKKKTMRRHVKRFIFFTFLFAIFFMLFLQSYRLLSPYVSLAYNSFANKYLTIREVSIVGASEYADKDIRSYVDPIISVTPTILALPAAQIKSFLYTRSYLKKAEVRRELPGRVVIEVAEKKPIAILVKKDLFLVDENGDIIRQMKVGENLDLPVITLDSNLNEKLGRDMIRTACNLIQLDAKSSPLLMPSEVCISGGQITVRSLELKNSRNSIPPIYLTPDGIEKKILYVKKLWPEIVNKKEELEYIDGRFRQGVLVKLKNTEVKNNG